MITQSAARCKLIFFRSSSYAVGRRNGPTDCLIDERLVTAIGMAGVFIVKTWVSDPDRGRIRHLLSVINLSKATFRQDLHAAPADRPYSLFVFPVPVRR